MPNHVDNTLTVYGPADSVDTFVAAAHGKIGCWDDKNGIEHLSMDALVSLDRTVRSENGSAQVEEQRRTWGVKWGAYGDDRKFTHDPSIVTYTFQTAWGPPDVFVQRIAHAFPDLHFFLSYGGEGPCRGRLAAHGQWYWLFDEEYEKFKPELPDKKLYETEEVEAWDNPEFTAAYDRVVNVRRLAHPLWVALEVARAEGHEFAADTPPGVVADWIEELNCPNHAQQVRRVDVPAGPMVDFEEVVS